MSMKNNRFILKALHRLYVLTHHDDWDKDVIADADEASRQISDLLLSDKPCMICRFGSVELINVTNYMSMSNDRHSVLKYITDKEMQWWRDEANVIHMKDNAGFFPNTEENMARFDKLMLEDAGQVDILGSWIWFEKFIEEKLPKTAVRIRLQDLEPFWSSSPWTSALAGKKVLVVHPFATLIEKQYREKKDLLFPGKDILPVFELKTLQAVQSIGGDGGRFANWFEALDYMKGEIDKEDYDICLIGCGAYGFPLAAHVKRSGKKAVHIGGATQLLFGIRGKRWEDPMYGVKERGLEPGLYSSLMNENWARPDDSMKPKAFGRVEGGCYW